MPAWLRGEDRTAALLAAGAFALPLSLVGAQVFLYAAVLSWLVEAVRARRAPELRSGLLLGGALYAAAAIASIWLGLRPEMTVARLHRLLLILLIPAVLRAARGREALPAALGLLLAAGTALRGLYDLGRFPVHVWVHHRNIPDFGNMRDPQFYMVALFLLLGAWLASPQSKSNPFGRAGRWLASRAWLPWAMALCALGLGLHQKRGVWLAFALSFVLLVILRRRWRWLLALAAGVALLAAVPATRARLADLQDIWNPKRGDRALLWSRIAPKLIADHPAGMGFKAITNDDLRGYARGVQPKLNHLHNNFLQVTAELGWHGVAVWTAWMAGGVVVFARRRSDPAGAALLCAFTGLLLNGMVESNFGDNEVYMLFLLLLGMASARRAEPPLAAET